MPLTARQKTIHNKNGAKRAASFNKGKRKYSEGDHIVTSAPTDLRSIAYPGGVQALVLLLTARIISAVFNHISDCDETYNYWEPLHYLVYGHGFQTWEYSPVFAIRSYMPLWLISLPARLLSYFLTPVSVFYALRIGLAIHTALAEFMFYKAVCHEFGIHVGRLWLGFTLPAAGSFVSSTAMLPSAWSGALVSAALACWWRKRYQLAIFLTAASTLLSWPFTAVLGLPIAIDMLILKRKYKEFFTWSIISLVIIMVPTILVDAWFYGKLVVAPWNIVAYNIFSENGPDLYGVEHWLFYFINSFLNFNIVIGLALLSPLWIVGCTLLSPRSMSRASFCSPYWLDLMPLVTWFGIFVMQPHKEERFLYPIYSLIVLGGAISLDCMQKMLFILGTETFNWFRDRDIKHYLASTASLMVICLSVSGVIGLSRITSLYSNYQGTVTILHSLPQTGTEKVVCYGKDWYRSPSSFHLPPGYKMRFIQSEFNGQMPAPYSDTPNATQLVHPYFNDKNLGVSTTYYEPSKCHYLVHSDVDEPTEMQPAYHKDPRWEVVATTPMIDSLKTNAMYRAFYIPFLSSKYKVYGTVFLLRNKML